jgi:hypothetical protein
VVPRGLRAGRWRLRTREERRGEERRGEKRVRQLER